MTRPRRSGRTPGWCRGAVVEVNGTAVDGPVVSGSYCRIRRRWEAGDKVTMDMPMPIVAMAADPRAGRFDQKAALTRGPLVYSFEGVDNPGIGVWNISVPVANGVGARGEAAAIYEPCGEPAGYGADFRPDMLNGCSVLTGSCRGPGGDSVDLTAISYYAVCNRGPTPFRVWVGAQ